MSLRTVLLLVVIALLALFVIVNWPAFTTPATLSLLVGTVEAPLGIVMLMITGALALVFLAYAFYLQTTVLLETRRMTRELAAQRQLADQAEASRFTELRTALDARFDRLEAAARGGTAQGDAAGVRARDDLREAIDQGVNTLAAQIAELDDRLAQRAGAPPGR
jgi:uncharacterized integral membrane protein